MVEINGERVSKGSRVIFLCNNLCTCKCKRFQPVDFGRLFHSIFLFMIFYLDNFYVYRKSVLMDLFLRRRKKI